MTETKKEPKRFSTANPVILSSARALGDGPRPQSGLLRMRRGVYTSLDRWGRTTREGRHRTRREAVLATRRSRPVLSHASAAIVWGIPIVGDHLGVVHVAEPGSTLASKNGVARHRQALRDDELAEVDGYLVTSLERTLLDLACSLGFASAVAALDAGTGETWATAGGMPVAGTPRSALRERIARERGRRGVRRALLATVFSDNRSGSPGESISRANMHLLRFPPPRLQIEFAREDGGVDRVDFDWKHLDCYGEFDGKAKYFDESLTEGRAPEEVLWDQKLRSDRLSLHRSRRIHWVWDMAINPERLRSRLVAGGLRPVAPRVHARHWSRRVELFLSR